MTVTAGRSTVSPTRESLTMTVGEFLLRRIREAGVGHAFGVPGDYNLELLQQIEDTGTLEWIGACNELKQGAGHPRPDTSGWGWLCGRIFRHSPPGVGTTLRGPAQPECDCRTGRLGCGAMPDDNADPSSPGGYASPGPGAGARRLLERLSDAESLELLASGGLGRLVYNSRYGLTALPVAYRIDEGSIVLGTWDPALFDEDLRTGIAQAEYQVAVEADQIDAQAREGWFVLVRGAAHHLDTEAERAPFIDAGLEPWVEGVPAHFIRVNPTEIWGNRTRRA